MISYKNIYEYMIMCKAENHYKRITEEYLYVQNRKLSNNSSGNDRNNIK